MVLRWMLVCFTVCFLRGNLSSERWSLCLVGVDIGVGAELTVNGDGVDEPAVIGAEDGDGPRIEDDRDRS